MGGLIVQKRFFYVVNQNNFGNKISTFYKSSRIVGVQCSILCKISRFGTVSSTIQMKTINIFQ